MNKLAKKNALLGDKIPGHKGQPCAYLCSIAVTSVLYVSSSWLWSLDSAPALPRPGRNPIAGTW
jgi:hypothetical protein